LKRNLTLAAAALAVLTLTPVAVLAAGGNWSLPTVQINGSTVAFSERQPLLQDDRLYVPIRDFAEALGARVNYDAATDTVQVLPKSAGTLYAFESDGNGFNTKNYFYDTGKEVIVFDAQFTPELAQQSIAFIRSKTQSPITHVVVTHPNPDKFNGIGEFQKLGAKVIASQSTADAIPGVHAYKKNYFVNVAKSFTDAAYPALVKPDITFAGQYELPLGNGETLTLHELSQPGVSSTQTIAYLPNAQAVLVGDLIHHGAHEWLEGGIVDGQPMPTVEGWKQDLSELKTMFWNQPNLTVYGGRGESASLQLAVDEQIRYLKETQAIIDDYLKTLGNAPVNYADLQKRFEAKFPDYKLGYMIAYGAYGLVMQEQARLGGK
jgi:glyoxylase-like metal-dependent hydrolase (beta-lactamase superfamily II)